MQFLHSLWYLYIKGTKNDQSGQHKIARNSK